MAASRIRAHMERYRPTSAINVPRYSGIRTFAHLPHMEELDDVDLAIVGIPFDTTTSFRPGARFGPDAIRSGSLLLRPFHPAFEIDIYDKISAIDYGDLPVTPGNATRTLEQIATGIRKLLAASVTPIVLGGDHVIVLGELRAYAEAFGPLGLVLIDAHSDTWDIYYETESYFHGTPFRRAVEEGLIDPKRSVFAGMRGSVYSKADLGDPREMGFDVIPCHELQKLTPDEFRARVSARIGDGPTYFSLDIDSVDPAFAPATGTPEIGGLFPNEVIGFIRSLAGIKFVGYDVVEVSPAYDSAGQITAILAANIAYEFMGLTAVAS